MWVVVRGGLGNQMFQVARSIAISNQFHVVPKYIDATAFARVERKWQLDCFGIKPHPVPKMTVAALAAQIKLARQISKITGKPSVAVVDDQETPGDDRTLRRAPKILLGYGQNTKYFYDSLSEVLTAFQFPDYRANWSIINESAGTNVALHIRRGDYVSDPHAKARHLVCEPDWYENAWSIMRREVTNANAFVFSDDVDWAKENVNLGGNVTFVQPDANRPAWVDMAEMSRCDHFIISNSSFSWWSAFLSQNESKVVIAPKYWRTGELTKEVGICPESWILS